MNDQSNRLRILLICIVCQSHSYPGDHLLSKGYYFSLDPFTATGSFAEMLNSKESAGIILQIVLLFKFLPCYLRFEAFQLEQLSVSIPGHYLNF